MDDATKQLNESLRVTMQQFLYKAGRVVAENGIPTQQGVEHIAGYMLAHVEKLLTEFYGPVAAKRKIVELLGTDKPLVQ